MSIELDDKKEIKFNGITLDESTKEELKDIIYNLMQERAVRAEQIIKRIKEIREVNENLKKEFSKLSKLLGTD